MKWEEEREEIKKLYKLYIHMNRCNLTVARMQKKKIKKGLHTQMWGVFKALVGKIETGGFLHPPMLML